MNNIILSQIIYCMIEVLHKKLNNDNDELSNDVKILIFHLYEIIA